MELSQKYQGLNYTQSMFERLLTASRSVGAAYVFNLKSQYRFAQPVSSFLSECFYNRQALNSKYTKPNENELFRLFHRSKDGFVFKFIETMMNCIPKQYSVCVVHPPEIDRKLLEQSVK